MAGDAPSELYAPAFNFGADPQPLLHLAEWINGLAFKNIAFTDDGLPVVKIAEIKSGFSDATKRTNGVYDDRVRLRNGDLLFCWSGQPETSIGTFVWDKGDAWLNQHIFRVLPGNGIDRRFFRFLMLYLQPNFQEIARNKQTTGLGHVTKGDLGIMMVQLPSRREQERIAGALQAVQDKLDLNRQMAATLEETARALFKSWFVDFDPVHAKAGGRDTGQSAEIAALFPDRFDDEGLPDGWRSGSLDDLADTNSESWKASSHPEEVEYVDLSNCKWGNIDGTAQYRWEDAPSRARRIARAGDTIFGTVRPGNGSYAFVGREGLTVSTGFAVLRPKEVIYREIVYFAATSIDNIRWLEQLAAGHGGAYPAVNPDKVSATAVVVVCKKVAQAFSTATADMIDRIELLKRESSELEQLRDMILPKLLSGELRVAGAQSVIAVA
ncbi:restriction endonuclease subunit S [Sphingomonas bacterium]|uniref:restriction endonuclease subunit S n=1 Tax=Sphingomonas bacterium TaxID=1895847 RepID=UPI0015768632|nr:restriction endonuclease subunit S [Sphingomonas bacterium]